METESQAVVRRRRRIPRWLLVIIIIVAALGALIGFTHLYYYVRVRSELAAVRKAGLPVTLAEADALYAVPPLGENAADGLTPAFFRYVPPPEDAGIPLVEGGALPPRGAPLSDAAMAATAKYLADNAEELAGIRQAASMTQCRWPVDLTKGPGAPLPHLAPLRTAAHMLDAAALARAQQHDAAGAAQSLAATLALAHTLAAEPVEMSQVTRNAIDATSVQALERVLSLAPIPDTSLPQLSSALELETEGRNEVGVLTFAAERCVGDGIFVEAAKWDNPFGSVGPYDTFRTQFYRAIGMIAADHLTFLVKMRQLIDAYRKPFPARLSATKSVAESVQHLPPMRELTPMLFPSVDQYIRGEAKTIAVLSAARAGLAVERYRAAMGKLPAALDDLVPAYFDAVPADPFDGKPLRYRELARGFVVYSIGPDGKDDGGTEWQSSMRPNADYDVTFIVESGSGTNRIN